MKISEAAVRLLKEYSVRPVAAKEQIFFETLSEAYSRGMQDGISILAGQIVEILESEEKEFKEETNGEIQSSN